MSAPNAEPKGATVPGDDSSGLKKASKKSSTTRRSVDGGASGPPTAATAPSPAATQATPVVHDIPRLAIADPKGAPGADATTTAKAARPAKKRTSTPQAELPGAVNNGASPSLPTASEGAPSAAAPKMDAEAAEKERARREAKRQRTREAEEQRKREELAKQALEDAQRKEEQRQRDLRRKQDLAALNANADVVQDEEDDDGYGDEGFEDYGDDFENDTDASPPAKAPPSSTVAPMAKPLAKASKSVARETTASAGLDTAELRRIQEAQKAESKELSTATTPGSKSSSKASSSSSKAGDSGGADGSATSTSAADAKRTQQQKHVSPASSIAASIAGLKQTLDPRARRTKEIRETRKLDVEKFNVFVQAPLAEVDIYLSRLRRGNVRQVAAQTKDDDKSVATQTRVPDLVDKSMHFPDDVGVDGTTSSSTSSSRRLKARGGKRSSRDNQSENQRRDAGGGVDSGQEDDDDDDADAQSMSSTRFLTFLEQSSQVCEQLIQENIQESDTKEQLSNNNSKATQRISRNATLSRVQLFPSKTFDQPALEKLLEERSLLALRFSPAVSNVLMTWHSASSKETRDQPTNRDENDGDDNNKPPATPVNQIAENTIACVWDLNQLNQVLYVLHCEPFVTTACLGPTRELLVLAGAEDGSVNVWDLRSRLTVAGRRYLPKYGLDVYAPTYSTCGADSRSIEGSHHSSIVSIQAVEHSGGGGGGGGTGNGGAFQFGSLDDRGVLLIWSVVTTATRDTDALLHDKCLTIGGRIKLVVSVVIDVQLQYLVLTRPSLRSHVRRAPTNFGELTRASTRARGSLLTGTGSSTRKSTTADDALLAELSVGPIATALSFSPDDPNQFLVGTTTGLVLRGNRYEKTTTVARSSSARAGTDDRDDAASLVACYRRDRHGAVAAPTPTGIAVTCLAIHPVTPGYFLVGYEDGRICLFDGSLTTAVATWEEVDYDTSVTTLQWSPSRASVFFASYSHGLVHAWDLTSQHHGPAFEHKLQACKDGRGDVGYPIALSYGLLCLMGALGSDVVWD